MVARSFKIVLVMALLSLTMAQPNNWQASGFGHGGWSAPFAPNLPRLEDILDIQIALMDAGRPVTTAAATISDQCQSLWDRTWNVAIAIIDDAKNMLVYGFAYNKHWAWYNRYKGSIYSISVWKDYNCRNYVTLNLGTVSANTNPTQAMAVRDNGLLTFLSQNDLWESVKRIVEEFENGLEIVASGVGFDDPAPTAFGVKFCGGDYFAPNTTFYSYQDYSVDSSIYKVLVFLTRTPPIPEPEIQP